MKLQLSNNRNTTQTKTYLLLYQAALYAKVSNSTISRWVENEYLSIWADKKLVDPDELDLLLLIRKKFGKALNNGSLHDWENKWEELVHKMKFIPTYIPTERQNVEYNYYRSKIDQDKVVEAAFLQAPFRVISKNYAVKAHDHGYLVKTKYKYLIDEQTILDYVFTNASFRDKLAQLLIGEDDREQHIIDEIMKGNEE